MKINNFSLLLSLLLLVSFTSSCEQKKAKPQKEKTTIILVHSAWFGGWQWKETISHLDH